MLIVRGVCVCGTEFLRAAWPGSPIPEQERHGSGGTLELPEANRRCESEILCRESSSFYWLLFCVLAVPFQVLLSSCFSVSSFVRL
jgi:hypothetical protein